MKKVFRFNKNPPDIHTFSYKVKLAMKRERRQYSWLAKQINFNWVDLNNKIEDNSWTLQEIIFLKKLLNIE